MTEITIVKRKRTYTNYGRLGITQKFKNRTTRTLLQIVDLDM